MASNKRRKASKAFEDWDRLGNLMKAKILISVIVIALLSSCASDAEVCRINLEDKCTVAEFLKAEKAGGSQNTFALPEYGWEPFGDSAGSLGAMLEGGLLEEGEMANKTPDLSGWTFYYCVYSHGGSSFGIYFLDGFLEGYLDYCDAESVFDTCEVERKVTLSRGKAQDIVASAKAMAKEAGQSGSMQNSGSPFEAVLGSRVASKRKQRQEKRWGVATSN